MSCPVCGASAEDVEDGVCVFEPCTPYAEPDEPDEWEDEHCLARRPLAASTYEDEPANEGDGALAAGYRRLTQLARERGLEKVSDLGDLPPLGA